MFGILSRLKKANLPDAAAVEAAKPVAEAITWTGDYQSFADAHAACEGDSGYHGDIAIDRYVRRHREVSADPRIFAENNQHLIRYMAALSSAIPIDGWIRVLDFGGGYGSLYDVIRWLLPNHKFDWTIVELPELVERGDEMGASAHKRFVSDIPDRQSFSMVIASGAIQYVPAPEAMLTRLFALDCKAFLIGRIPICPFIERDRLTVQSVPPSLFAAKFPSWIFSPRWRQLLRAGGDRALTWESPGDIHVLDGKQFPAEAYLLLRD